MNFLKIDYDKRVFGLDVFRAIAILLVVRSHGGIISGDIFRALPSIPLIDGVELFFVLSGFLIGTILLNKYEEKNEEKIKSIFVFWKRRWYRTLPNYYLILVINILLVKYEYINGNIQNFNYTFIIFMQNFSEGFVDFFWESWSLSIEEWFYVIVPLFIFGISFFVNKKNTLLIVITLLIILPLFYRISMSSLEVDVFWHDVHFRKTVLTRLDAIIYGVLAAFVNYYYPVFFLKSKNIMFVLGLIIIYFNLYIPKEPNDFYTKTFFYSLNSLGASLLLAKANSIKNFRINSFGKIITFISIISYSMYLVNLAMVAQVLEKNFNPQTNKEHLIAYIIYWFSTIIISTLIYKFFEKPIMDLRDK